MPNALKMVKSPIKNRIETGEIAIVRARKYKFHRQHCAECSSAEKVGYL
jgi:hypothetical protein